MKGRGSWGPESPREEKSREQTGGNVESGGSWPGSGGAKGMTGSMGSGAEKVASTSEAAQRTEGIPGGTR